MALAAGLLLLSGLGGCIYSDAAVDLERTEAFHPLATGYWKVCLKEAGRRETCQVIRHEAVRANSGVITRADDSTVGYSAVPLGSGSGKFLVQLRKTWEGRDRNAYALGETSADGSVALLSPDCAFPSSVRADLRQAAVPLAFSFRTCPPREDSAQALLTMFGILARHRDWQGDASAAILPMEATVGRADFDMLRQAMALAFGTAVNQVGAAALGETGLLTYMKAALDQRFSAWSEAWHYDQYVGGSATVPRVECSEGLCAVAGTFRFTRFGIFFHTIPFGAVLERSGTGTAIVRGLCYRDDSSNFNDCITSDRR